MASVVLFFAAALTTTTGLQQSIGSARRRPLDVFFDGRAHYKAVRKAETSWRRAWQKRGLAPDPSEAAQVFRALGTIQDASRISALVWAVDRCAFDDERAVSKMYAAAACALADSGSDAEAAVLLEKRPTNDLLAVAMAGSDPDPFVAELRGNKVVQRTLIKTQRFGRLDLHGLDWPQARLALHVVLRAPGILDGDENELVVVTGRGLHSKGSLSLRDHFLALVDEMQLSVTPLTNNAGAFALALPPLAS